MNSNNQSKPFWPFVAYILSYFIHQAKAFGRYALAKQHEDPLNLIDDYRYPRNITTAREWPEAKEVLQKGEEGAEEKKFGLHEVEVWIVLASIFGAILALVTLQLIKLVRINFFLRPRSNALSEHSKEIVEAVIREGLESVSRTKRVVVMNLHFMPCEAGANCSLAKISSTNGVMITKEFHHHPRHYKDIENV